MHASINIYSVYTYGKARLAKIQIVNNNSLFGNAFSRTLNLKKKTPEELIELLY